MLRLEYLLDTSFTQNRELSWLRFNERVLEEANDNTVPLLERLKFLAIFTSNLDEFFMIRVGSLFDLSLLPEAHIDNKSGMPVQEQLNAIYQAVAPLYRLRDRIYARIDEQLRQYDISCQSVRELGNQNRKYIRNYFESDVLPLLSPQIIDVHHPFPHLENKQLYIGLMLRVKDDLRFAIIPVPKSLPRIILLPGAGISHVLLEDVILEYAETVFSTYDTVEKTILAVTRNADINPDDEAYELEEDFRLRMKKMLRKRSRLAPVRLEIRHKLDSSFVHYLCSKLNLKKEQIYISDSPLDLSYIFTLDEHLSVPLKRILMYAPFEPHSPASIREGQNMISQIARKDILLYYPYDSMEPFLRLVREASVDPSVISIKMTLYRIDKKSKLAEHLITAAENGKDVMVLMELRARFDEQNNIDWAERLEESGCKVMFGFEGIKVHAKICLITRRDKNRLQYITQLGTGNYNEKTAKLYSDYSLMTANMKIGSDAALFFKNMSIANLDGQYGELLVAPRSFKSSIMALMDGEIEKQRSGKPAGILFKLNSLTDRDILDKLSQASRAGVPVRMIVRGICCILPGIPDKTENITVNSIVGRFLEHARVYCFGSEDDMRIYISSADLMTRNTERRVELACPILDDSVKASILSNLKAQLSDNTKARRIQSDGSYAYISVPGDAPVNSQELAMHNSVRSTREKPSDYRELLKTVLHFFDRR